MQAFTIRGMFVGYCENSKAFRIHVHGKRKIEFSSNVTFYEDVSFGKVRDLPLPPPVENKDDDMDLLEGPSMPKSERDIVDDPMELMDTLDPTPCDPSLAL